jgi:hypothetical protein
MPSRHVSLEELKFVRINVLRDGEVVINKAYQRVNPYHSGVPKAQVKSLCLSKYHAMKTYGGVDI